MSEVLQVKTTIDFGPKSPRLSSQGRGQIYPVQGVRVLLGYVILFAHNFRPSLSIFKSRDLLSGRVCVAIYFVMAGYFSLVSLCSRRGKKSILSFYAARILPVLVIILISCLFCIALDPVNFPYSQLISWKGNPVTNIWPYYLGLDLTGRIFSPNLPLWYLSVQILFWLVTPALKFPIVRMKWWMCVGLVPIVVVCDTITFFVYPNNVRTRNDMMAGYYTPLIWIAKHVEGMLVAKFVMELRDIMSLQALKRWTEQIPLSLVVDLCLLIALAVYTFIPDVKHWAYPWDQEPCFFIHPAFLPILAVWGLVNIPIFSVPSRLLGCRWCQRVAPGATSLVVYAIHTPFFVIVDQAGLQHRGQLSSLTMIYLTALAIEHYVMSPVQKQVNKF